MAEERELTLEDFPFDPAFEKQEKFFDLPEKLKCVKDEKTRQLFWEAWRLSEKQRVWRRDHARVKEQTFIPWDKRPREGTPPPEDESEKKYP